MLSTLAVALLPLMQSTTTLDAVPAVDDLAWFQGDWRSSSEQGSVQEIWSQPHGDNMIGMFRWQRPDGSPMVYEMLAIREEEQGITLRLRHFDKQLNPWAAEADGPITLVASKVTGTSVRFEDRGAGHDVEAITYTRTDKQFVVRVEFDADRDPLEVRMTLAE